jgi:hypothetical protein
VDGQWNLWSQWSECSQTCNGIRTRYRLCASPAPECDGEVCRKLPDTKIDIVTIENNSTVVEETDYDKCNQLCKLKYIIRCMMFILSFDFHQAFLLQHLFLQLLQVLMKNVMLPMEQILLFYL